MTEPQPNEQTPGTGAMTEAAFVEQFIERLRAVLASGQPYTPDDPLVAHVSAIVHIAYYAYVHATAQLGTSGSADAPTAPPT